MQVLITISCRIKFDSVAIELYILCCYLPILALVGAWSNAVMVMPKIVACFFLP